MLGYRTDSMAKILVKACWRVRLYAVKGSVLHVILPYGCQWRFACILIERSGHGSRFFPVITDEEACKVTSSLFNIHTCICLCLCAWFLIFIIFHFFLVNKTTKTNKVDFTVYMNNETTDFLYIYYFQTYFFFNPTIL